MQTNHTLFLAKNQFAPKKEEKIRETRLMSKDWGHLFVEMPIKFSQKIIQMTIKGIRTPKQKRQITFITIIKET